jgi:hypothetical protein
MEMALSLRNNRAFGAELVLPMNAIALDNDEMEYVDGGSDVYTLFAGAIIGAVGFLIGWAGKIMGQSFAHSSISVALLAAAFRSLGVWAAVVLDSVVGWAWINPEVAAMAVSAVVLGGFCVLHSWHVI